MRRQKIARVAQVPEGATFKFKFGRGLDRREGFVAHFHGQLVAYENQCQHLPVTLDFGDHQLFTRDGRRLVCQSHGALYEPLTGLCVAGPCAGLSLRRLPITVRDDCIWLETTRLKPPPKPPPHSYPPGLLRPLTPRE